MQVLKKTDSKVLGRTYVEILVGETAGKITRKEAVEAAAKELGVPADRVALLALEGESGSRSIVGSFYVYESQEARKKLHPRHLDERLLTKEERDKLKQERKKAAAPAAAAAPEAKK